MCTGGAPAMSCGVAANEFAGCGAFDGVECLPYLESMELETLGTLVTVPTAGPAMLPAAASAQPSSAQMAAPEPLPLGILPPAGALMGLPGAVN
jgi:hypothetical protein